MGSLEVLSSGRAGSRSASGKYERELNIFFVPLVHVTYGIAKVPVAATFSEELYHILHFHMKTLTTMPRLL